jgi:hypothetical protein
VEGLGSGHSYDIAKEVALANAFRTAVERVAGVYIKSESEVKDFQLLKDRVLSESKGVVSTYNIIKEERLPSTGEEKEIKLTVECTVSWAAFRERWQHLRDILRERGLPRLIVEVAVDFKAMPEGLHTSFNKNKLLLNIKKIFTEAGFELIRPEIAKTRRDMKLLFEFKCDASTSFVLGTEVQKYTLISMVQGTMFRMDTGKDISNISKTYTHHDLNAVYLVSTGLDKAGEQFAKDMIHEILRQSWDYQATEGESVEVIIEKISYRQVRELKKALETNSALKKVVQGEYNHQMVHFTLRTNLTADKLLDLVYDIGEKSGIGFDVKKNTANQIVLEVVPK